ncbi:MAG: TonB-dependent receptor [Thiobacillus sp.]|uniref:TonB-dependent receptor n=1 Tax=Thiobacillus sp. TaxID=924 RepID=UPI0027341AFE|nr:TonB-dependent receptor [Thiobacillus sp.]MDP3585705.1 TonB-dependent receptor [Thiobacillus sp.]
MFRVTLLAAALTAAFPAYAQSDLDALRAELKEMKTAYEARIQALEARLQKTEVQTADTAVRAAPVPEASAPARISFNPDISLILQGRYAHLDDIDERHISGFLPAGHAHGTPRGFSLDHTELVLSASVDPYFRGYFNLALVDEEVEIEEAWFQTTSLGHGVTVKGGRFLSGLGYQNEQHPHAWDFADNSLMYRALFGEAYGNDGVQLKWVAPTALFMEFGAEAGRGANFPGTDRNKNGAGSATVFGHLGGDVGTSHSWRAGLSYLHAKASDRDGEIEDLNDEHAETLFSGTSKTWVADVVWKWAPDGNAHERNFKFAAEYFRRAERGSLECEDNTADGGACDGTEDAYRSRQSGYYAQGVYQFMPRWRTGYRYDRLNPGTVDFGANSAFLPVTDHKPTRHSLMLDYSPSEFSRLRLQYSKDQSMASVSENQWFVQYIHSLGAHGAHRF